MGLVNIFLAMALHPFKAGNRVLVRDDDRGAQLRTGS